MKLIYTLILLLFSSSVFADFVDVKGSISELLDYGFRIKQIDTIDMHTHVYHLIMFKDIMFEEKTDGSDVAICVTINTRTFCKIDTQDKSLIEHFKEDDYLEQLIIEDVERDKELLAEEMDD